MTDNVENLMLEILRGIRADLTDLRTETREGFRETRSRLSAIEQKIGGHAVDVVDLNARYDSILRRIERIEKRLELSE
ncbi:MAG: hypothetical protein ACREUT_18245 [Steroidobacteraceae bacterium]